MVMPKRTTRLHEAFERPATPRTLDFTGVRDTYYIRDERGLMRMVNRKGFRMDMAGAITTESTTYREPLPGGASPETGLSMTSKQARARARRRLKRGKEMADEAWDRLYKPIEEWDMEELARGRCRAADGSFRGMPPKFITREIHERAMERFKTLVRDELNARSLTALTTIQFVLQSEEVDDKGKPLVPAGVKLDAAKYLLDHVVGKPMQPTTTDISVKLQGILGAVMVTPSELPASYKPAQVGQRGIAGEIYDAEEVDEEDVS